MREIVQKLRGGLIVSCQAAPGDPLEDTGTILRIAQSVITGGAVGLRINSPEHIAAIRKKSEIPIVGIQKRYTGGETHITPDFTSAAALAHAGASIIALDCTQRVWPDAEPWRVLIARIHRELDLPVMADIATFEEAMAAAAAGADMVGTTLNGYTEPTRNNHQFSWPLLSDMVNQVEVPVVAEGHISSPDQAQRALAMGAWCVIVGSAITRPGAIAASFVRAMQRKARVSAVGVDLGGTCVKGGLVDSAGEVSLVVQAPTNARGGRDAIAASLCRVVEQVVSASRERGCEPAGLGIASAGAIDPHDGSVFAATDNLPGWAGFELRKFAEKRLSLPTWVVNDAHAAVLAELHFGVGRSLSDFVAITIGTGIGGGIVCGRKLLTGQHGFAGTIGHHVIREGGLACNCGRRGCLEAYVSTAALIREYEDRAGPIADRQSFDDAALALHINQLATSGSPEAAGAYEALARYLSEGIANIFNLFDPEAILISGGLVEGQPKFVASVAEQVPSLMHFGTKRKPLVKAATSGRFAGVQGAATLVFAGQT
jgi:N-acetylmannosamine-6-phosphate 2-epimerase / N-acetylmannosamine kinase